MIVQRRIGFALVAALVGAAAVHAAELPSQRHIDKSKDGEAAIPYTDAGRAAFKNHDAKDDPTSLCLYPGMPRIMQSPYPIQIIQTQEYVTILFEYMRQFRANSLGVPASFTGFYTVFTTLCGAKP